MKTKYHQIMESAIAHFGAGEIRTSELKSFFARSGASYVPQNMLMRVRAEHGVSNLALWSETAPIGDPIRQTQNFTQIATLSDDDMIAQYTNKIQGLENAIRQCVRSRNGKEGLKAILCGGAPGMGKTFTTRRVLEEMLALNPEIVSVKYITAGNITSYALFCELFLSSSHGQVIVFDDSDALFEDSKSLNTLKSACDMGGHKRKIEWLKSGEMEYNGESIPTSFDYNGSIIVLSNIHFDDEIAKQTKRASHLAAFTSRASYIDLHMTASHYRPVILGMIERGILLTQYSDIVKHVAIQFLQRNWNNFKQNPSIRLVCELARYADMNITETTLADGEVKIDGIQEFISIATATKL